jgi:CBS domain-containing protein
MVEKSVHSIPVMEGDTLLGIIGKLDVIKGLAREKFTS